MTDEITENTEHEAPINEVRLAPQDIPRDPGLMPEGTVVITDEFVSLSFKYAYMRPATHTHKNIVLDLHGTYTDRQCQKIILWFWGGVKPGYSMFIRPEFPVKPDVKPEHRLMEGFKRYTK